MQQFPFLIVALALVAAIVALPQVQVFKDGGFAGANANLPGDYQKCGSSCSSLLNQRLSVTHFLPQNRLEMVGRIRSAL